MPGIRANEDNTTVPRATTPGGVAAALGEHVFIPARCLLVAGDREEPGRCNHRASSYLSWACRFCQLAALDKFAAPRCITSSRRYDISRPGPATESRLPSLDDGHARHDDPVVLRSRGQPDECPGGSVPLDARRHRE